MLGGAEHEQCNTCNNVDCFGVVYMLVPGVLQFRGPLSNFLSRLKEDDVLEFGGEKKMLPWSLGAQHL